jgi:hypothetical protein
MLSFPIKRTWIFSRTAGKIYFVSSLAGYGLFIFVFATVFSEVMIGPLPSGYLARLIFRSAFAIGALGLATLWVGMWLCVLRFDFESISGTIFLIVFIVFGPLGSLVYYATRYRKLLKRDLDPARAFAAPGSS